MRGLAYVGITLGLVGLLSIRTGEASEAAAEHVTFDFALQVAGPGLAEGTFELIDLPPAPRGVPQIEVTFDIDADGVVQVSAKDLGTGKSQAIQVTASSGLSEEEVDRLVQEAEEHSEADQERRDWIDVHNQADGLIYSTERTLEEYAEHVSPEDAEALKEALEKARRLLAAEDTEGLEAAVDELSGLSYQMTESLYEKLGGEGSE